MPPKIFFIACEPSGDTHGAHLIEAIKKLNPQMECIGLGGPKMKEVGMRLIYDMTTFSALGLGDVLRQYFDYRRVFHQALREAKSFKPDTIILIDSPAFNLRFAKKIYKQFPILYYISPQLWAWGGRRIHEMKRTISKMLVILPFEKELYDKVGIPCDFVGHPLLDQVKASADQQTLRKGFKIEEHELAVGLVPGSREKEVTRILPLMLKCAELMKKQRKNIRFFLTEASNVPDTLYENILSPYPHLQVERFRHRRYDILKAMHFALITSGTATTEAAILGIPFFLLYKSSLSTYLLGKQLIQVPYLGLINLLAKKSVVPEFIQNDIVPERIAHEAQVLWSNQDLYERMKWELKETCELLGSPGASAEAAKSVVAFLNENKQQEAR